MQQELELLERIEKCCKDLRMSQEIYGPHEFTSKLTTKTIEWLQIAVSELNPTETSRSL